MQTHAGLLAGRGLTGLGGNEGGEAEGVLSSSDAKEKTAAGNGIGEGGGALGKGAEGLRTGRRVHGWACDTLRFLQHG